MHGLFEIKKKKIFFRLISDYHLSSRRYKHADFKINIHETIKVYFPIRSEAD